jgi:hypothetical protein
MHAEPVDSAALRAEFDALMARGGLSVIPDRYEGTLANYIELRRLASVLRTHTAGIDPHSEPAHVFRMSILMRAL